jgi:hypothetical protein
LHLKRNFSPTSGLHNTPTKIASSLLSQGSTHLDSRPLQQNIGRQIGQSIPLAGIADRVPAPSPLSAAAKDQNKIRNSFEDVPERWKHVSAQKIFQLILDKVIQAGSANMTGTIAQSPIEWRGEYLSYKGSSERTNILPAMMLNEILSSFSVSKDDPARVRGLAIYNLNGERGDIKQMHLVLGPRRQLNSAKAPPTHLGIFGGMQGHAVKQVPASGLASAGDVFSEKGLQCFAPRLSMLKCLVHLPPFRQICGQVGFPEYELLHNSKKECGQPSSFDFEQVPAKVSRNFFLKYCPNSAGPNEETTFSALANEFPDEMRSMFGLTYDLKRTCRKCGRVETDRETSLLLDLRKDIPRSADLSQTMKSAILLAAQNKDKSRAVCSGCKFSDPFDVSLLLVHAPRILTAICHSSYVLPEQVLQLDRSFGLPDSDNLYQLISISSLCKRSGLWKFHCRQVTSNCDLGDSTKWINGSSSGSMMKLDWSRTLTVLSKRTLQLFFVHMSCLDSVELTALGSFPHAGFDVGNWICASYYSDPIWYTAEIVAKLDYGRYRISWDDGGTEDTVKHEKEMRLLREISSKHPSFRCGVRVTARQGESGRFCNAMIVKCFTKDRFLIVWESGFKYDRLKYCRDLRLFTEPTADVLDLKLRDESRSDSTPSGAKRRGYRKRSSVPRTPTVKRNLRALKCKGTEDAAASGKFTFCYQHLCISM